MPAPTPAPPPANAPTPTTRGDAIRFLEQSTFGVTEAAIDDVMKKGPALVIEEEFAKPATGFPAMPAVVPDRRTQCPDGSPPTCERDNYTAFPLQRVFFQNAVGGADQLRQRVAFALSQIVVVSGETIQRSYALRNFQQMLYDNAFGNYREVLLRTTLSPVMGDYLDMVNNNKADPARGTKPNENYARELLQLFSIGLYELNLDGTQKLDPQNRPVPSYEQETIVEFSKVFTGWTFPTRPGATPRFPNPEHYQGDMIPFAANHETSTKTLLTGKVLPANQTPEKDIADAIDNVFQHPNVGPYIGKQLIQFLVMSNPSPQYVARVSSAFNDNGQGMRGDMKAVIRAVLRDPEARGDTKTEVNAGKLKEPVLFMTSLVRGLGGASDGVYLQSRADALGQPPFDSPTVFNFFPPSYQVPGTDVLGPPFQIMQTATILNRANLVNDLLFARNEVVAAQANVAGSTGTRTNAAQFNALAADPGALVDRLAGIFVITGLTAADRQSIVTAVTAVPANDAIRRVRTAVYLLVTSAQSQVTR